MALEDSADFAAQSAGESEAGKATAASSPGTEAAARLEGSEDRGGDVIVGPDDVDRHGWQYGFGIGERVPRETLDAQRDRAHRMDALYEEWRQSRKDPQEFFREHEEELRALSHGFVGLEVEPSEVGRAPRSAERPVKRLVDRPPPAVGVFDDTLHPCDRPAHSVTPLVNCSPARTAVLNDAIDHAEYVVWRTLWLLDRIIEADPVTAEALWRDGFTLPHAYDELHWQLQNWFGDYSQEQAVALRSAFQTLWDRWLGPGADGIYVNYAGNVVESAFECYVDPEWWQWRLWLKYIVTINPCLYGTGTAHHLYATGPQFCGEFFGLQDTQEHEREYRQAGVIIHELLHWVRINGFLIKDTHDFVCEWNDGDFGFKCYSDEEVLNLAENFPGIAILNNENYEDYSARYMNHWLSGNCMDPDVCAEVDDMHPNCQQEPPPPPPPDYPDCPDPNDKSYWGDPGCPCADVLFFTIEDIALDGGAPDGEGSYVTNGLAGPGQYCRGSGDISDAEVVCGVIPGPDPNSSNDDYSICKRCDDEGPDATRIGCPCQSDFDCQGGAETNLACWGSKESGWLPAEGAKCLPDGSLPNHEWHEEHRWFCLDNCGSMALGAGEYGCYYDQDPDLGQADHGECITLSNPSCLPLTDGECEIANNQQCNESGKCDDECKETQDCVERGFPDTYICDSDGDVVFEPGHCVPPECANTSSPYCDLFR